MVCVYTQSPLPKGEVKRNEYKEIMMLKIYIRGICFLFGLILSTSLFAEEKWYRVEVLVFENNDKEALSQAFASQSKPNFTNAINLSQMPNEKFRPLSDNQFTLAEAKSKIQKRYRLITHKGWSQTLESKNEAIAVHLNHGDLDGIVRLSGGKYLHIDTDMLLHKQLRTDGGLQEGLQAFRMKDSSRIRANEIHYIDHPLYGMIITVTPEKG